MADPHSACRYREWPGDYEHVIDEPAYNNNISLRRRQLTRSSPAWTRDSRSNRPKVWLLKGRFAATVDLAASFLSEGIVSCAFGYYVRMEGPCRSRRGRKLNVASPMRFRFFFFFFLPVIGRLAHVTGRNIRLAPLARGAAIFCSSRKRTRIESPIANRSFRTVT